MENQKPEVGQVLYSSWGYDQTNIDFYQIVRVSEKGSVWLQPMERAVLESVGFMSYMVVPGNVQYEQEVWQSVGEPNENGYCEKERVKVPVVASRHKWHGYGVSLNSYSGAYLWDGKPKNMTQYA